MKTIEEQRLTMGLSQAEFVRMVGISAYQTIKKIDRGAFPRASTFKKLVDAGIDMTRSVNLNMFSGEERRTRTDVEFIAKKLKKFSYTELVEKYIKMGGKQSEDAVIRMLYKTADSEFSNIKKVDNGFEYKKS